MAYVLRRDYSFKSDTTGKTITGSSYHTDAWILGCPTGSTRIQDAKQFPTKTLAEVYARNKLRGRGYKPMKLETETA